MMSTMPIFDTNPSRLPSLLFVGDSITDADWRSKEHRPLGYGYVGFIDEALNETSRTVLVSNRGISGNEVPDLIDRWETDVLQLQPDVLTVMVGINDMWRRYDSDRPTTTEQFENGYRTMVARRPECRLVLMEPFLLPVTPAQQSWREDLDPKIEVVRRIAAEVGATLLPLDDILSTAAETQGAASIAWDGVHLTRHGHRMLAEIWLDAVLGEPR